MAVKLLGERHMHVAALRRAFVGFLRENAGPVAVNGPGEGALPYVLNLSFPGCQADILLMNLDLAGVCCSTGSACSSGSLLPSPVLQAMAVPAGRLRSAMRFSFSHLLTEDEVLDAAERVAEIAKRLRARGE
jgi:cysteine desulfurase